MLNPLMSPRVRAWLDERGSAYSLNGIRAALNNLDRSAYGDRAVVKIYLDLNEERLELFGPDPEPEPEPTTKTVTVPTIGKKMVPVLLMAGRIFDGVLLESETLRGDIIRLVMATAPEDAFSSLTIPEASLYVMGLIDGATAASES